MYNTGIECLRCSQSAYCGRIVFLCRPIRITSRFKAVLTFSLFSLSLSLFTLLWHQHVSIPYFELRQLKA